MHWRKYFLKVFEIGYQKVQLSLYLYPFENLFKRREYLKKVLYIKESKSSFETQSSRNFTLFI